MTKQIAGRRSFYRLAEAIVPILTWAIITLPIWLSPFRPAVASYFILAFFIYFLYKSLKTVYFAGIAYKFIERAGLINWHKRVIKLDEYKQIHHFIIITNYKETAKKLSKTLERIKDQKYSKEHVHIVLAMEEREGVTAKGRSSELKEKFASHFGGFHTTFHVLAPDEIVGKASNESFAARYIDRLVKEKNISPKEVMITICDATSLLPDQYLAYLTYEYIKDKSRQYHFYYAPVLLYRNFWRLPLPIRVQSILSSVLRLSLLPQSDDLIQISTYSTNLWLLKQVDFWDVDIIPEDWHIWLQAFFKFGEKVRTLPIYIPVSADAVLSEGMFRTFRNRYEQERRWAWGATDIPYAIKRFFETPHISAYAKLRKILFLVEKDVFWSTSFFILTVSAFIPPLVNPVFRRTVMGFLLPRLSSIILTASSLLLFIMLYFDYKMRARVKIKTKLRSIPLLFVQWYLLPIISFLFSSLPALEAQTRLLLGKKLEYKPSEKI